MAQYDFEGAPPYGAAQGVAALRQRMAMHIHARGFHGLAALDARRTARNAVKLRRVKRIKTASIYTGFPTGAATYGVGRYVKRTKMPKARIRQERRMGLSADPIFGDTLAGSYDGLGATYGARTKLKAKRGVPLKAGERQWLARDRALRRHDGSRKRHLARQRGPFFTQTSGLGEDTGLEGKGSKRFLKNIKKIGRYTAAGAVLAPAAIFGGKKGAVAVGKIAGSKKFEKFTAKAVTPLRIAAAVVATAGAASVFGGAGSAVATAAKAAKAKKALDLLMLAKKIKATRDKLSAARKAAGLPPITFRGSPQQEAEQSASTGQPGESGVTPPPPEPVIYGPPAPSVMEPSPVPRGPVTDGGESGGSGSATGGMAPEADKTATSEASAPAGGGMNKGVLIAAAAVVALLVMKGRKGKR